MKKKYFEPDFKVTEMEIKRSVLEYLSDDDDVNSGDEDTNKRNVQGGKDVTWGNLW